ncbi:MAG: Ribosomal large subunit pseudouridine synthase D [Chlamydiae bacterium]|nr:Ribosomal large subunit pseudouridine synthase D [Chlamydiota bacterium]
MITLLDALSSQHPESSKNTLRGWIAHGRVFVDGRSQRINTEIDPEQQITLGAKREPLGKSAYVVYEDSSFIVVDKPAGLLSVATDKETIQTLHNLLKRRFHRPRIVPVHRLDRETSGLIVFAYSDETLQALKDQLQKRKMHRSYEATVQGIVEADRGTWSYPLFERRDFHVVVDPKGQTAVTHFRVIKRRKQTTLLEVELETGRKHQIRVHCSHAGHPILGDKRYGAAAGRMMLHAKALRLVHPKTGKLMHFTA